MVQYTEVPLSDNAPLRSNSSICYFITSIPLKLLKSRLRYLLLVPICFLVIFLTTDSKDYVEYKEYVDIKLDTSYQVASQNIALLASKIQLGTNQLKIDISKKLGYNSNIYTLKQSTLGEDPKWDNVGIEMKLGSSLEARLIDWEKAPLEGLGSSEWMDHNLKTCTSNIVKNQNTGMKNKNTPFWEGLDSTKIRNLRQELTSYLRLAKLEGKMDKAAFGTGKGLVFTAGNVDTFSRVLTTLRLLNKHLDTHLPVEIFSFPGEVASEEVRIELESYGAKFIVVDGAVKVNHGKDKSYHIKATAIIRSSFREVLYLDSDNLPAAGLTPAPETLFFQSPKTPIGSAGLWESKSYKRLGVMFWSDYWKTSSNNAIWSIIGVQCRNEWEQESGQILIDKSLHLDALLLTEYMLDSSRFKFWFQFSDGDKDLFRFSFLALRKRWGVPGRYVGVAGFKTRSEPGFGGGHTMLQHDHLGRPLFIHANMLKGVEITEPITWSQSRSASLPVSSLLLSDRSNTFVPEFSELVDLDVDCDQLANADIEGIALRPAGPATRRRAIIENGILIEWNRWINWLYLLDASYTDIRTGEEIEKQKSILISRHKAIPGEDQTLSIEERPEVTFTADGLELYWGESSFETRLWSDDDRLKNFENIFVTEGGIKGAPEFA